MEFSKSCNIVLISVLMFFIAKIQAYTFYAGGRDGWVTNPSESYDDWAGRNRFQVNDTIVFRYQKGDNSVLLVSKNDYDTCNINNPQQKLDGGDSTFKFPSSGPFYFISGNQDDCKKGQKLHIIVLAVRGGGGGATAPITTPPSPPAFGTPPATTPTPPFASSPSHSASPIPAVGAPTTTPAVGTPPVSSFVAPTQSPVVSPAGVPTAPIFEPAVSPSPSGTAGDAGGLRGTSPASVPPASDSTSDAHSFGPSWFTVTVGLVVVVFASVFGN